MFGTLSYYDVTLIKPFSSIRWNGNYLEVLESYPLDTKYKRTARAFALLTNEGWFCQSYDTIVAWEGWFIQTGNAHRTWAGSSRTTSKHINKFEVFLDENIRSVRERPLTPGMAQWIEHVDSGHTEYVLEEKDVVEDNMLIKHEDYKTVVAYIHGYKTCLTYGELVPLESHGALVKQYGTCAVMSLVSANLEVYVPEGTYHHRFRVVSPLMFNKFKKVGLEAFPEFDSLEEALEYWNAQGKPKFARGRYFENVLDAKNYTDTINRICA